MQKSTHRTNMQIKEDADNQVRSFNLMNLDRWLEGTNFTEKCQLENILIRVLIHGSKYINNTVNSQHLEL